MAKGFQIIIVVPAGKKMNLGQKNDGSQRKINGLLGLWQEIPMWSKIIWNLHGLSFQLTTTLRSNWDLASLSGQKKIDKNVVAFNHI